MLTTKLFLFILNFKIQLNAFIWFHLTFVLLKCRNLCLSKCSKNVNNQVILVFISNFEIHLNCIKYKVIVFDKVLKAIPLYVAFYKKHRPRKFNKVFFSSVIFLWIVVMDLTSEGNILRVKSCFHDRHSLILGFYQICFLLIMKDVWAC